MGCFAVLPWRRGYRDLCPARRSSRSSHSSSHSIRLLNHSPGAAGGRGRTPRRRPRPGSVPTPQPPPPLVTPQSSHCVSLESLHTHPVPPGPYAS